MRERLADRHHAPLHVGHDFPPLDGVAVDAQTRRLFVGAVEVFSFAETADLSRRTEAPRPHAHPRKVLPRIAEMSELPIEYGTDPVGTDDEVPVAEVSVDERDAIRSRHP